MSTEQPSQSLTVFESGFKILPGKESDFFSMHEKMLPLATSQPGFVSTYGGPIVDSVWLYASARFATQDDMDKWHFHKQHTPIQRTAYRAWWSEVYMRKWRKPTAGEAYGDKLMCETNLLLGAELHGEQLEKVRGLLSQMSEYGVKPFETMTEQYEPRPYQLVGPMSVAPARTGAPYCVISHWRSVEDVKKWESSAAYRELTKLGEVSNETFTALVETSQRDNMREDRLQREWKLAPAG
jgi:hypothetical protein